MKNDHKYYIDEHYKTAIVIETLYVSVLDVTVDDNVTWDRFLSQ